MGGGGGGMGDCSGEGGCVVTICAECDRFLYNMMRMLSGTLVQVGLGKLSVQDVADLLRARGRKGVHNAQGHDIGSPGKAVVFKAPPQGLCLETVFLEMDHGKEWMSPPKEEPPGGKEHSSAAMPVT